MKRSEEARKAGSETSSLGPGYGSYVSPLPGARPQSSAMGMRPLEPGEQDLMEELGSIAHDLRVELSRAQSQIQELEEQCAESDFHNQRLALEASKVPLLEAKLEAALSGLPEDVEAQLWKARYEEAKAEAERLRQELTQRDYEETALMHEAEQVLKLNSCELRIRPYDAPSLTL